MSSGVLDRQSLQEWQGGVWDYVSPSRLACWLKCPLAFRLRYLDGVKTPTTPSLFLGGRVHSGLELHYRHRQLGITLPPSQIANRLLASWEQAASDENMKFASMAVEKALQNQAVNLVTAYLGCAPKEEKPMAVEVAMNAPLVDSETGDELGIPLVGIMDLVLDTEEGPLVADFKTSARSAEPLEITHEIQLTSYSYLLRYAMQRHEAGLEIRSLIKTRVPKVEFHRYPARTDAHFHRLFRVIREYLDALDAGKFNFRPGFGCGLCDFRDGLCRKWAG